jgi:hypothetical protein
MTGDIKFSVSLVDGITPSAQKASASISEVRHKLDEAKVALSTYQAQQRRAAAIGDVEGYRRYSDAIKHARGEVYLLTDALGPLKKETGGVGESLKTIAEGVGLERLGEIALETGRRIVEGVVDGLKEVVATAFEVVEVNERMRASFEALGGAGAGEKTLAFVDDLARKLPQSRAQLAGWTKEIQALGITDLGQIRGQVLALASAQAIMGDEGVAAFKQLQLRIRGYAEAGQGVKLETRSLAELYRAGVTQNDIAHAMGITTAQLAAELKAGTVNATKFGNALTEALVAKGKGPLEAMGNELGTLKEKAIETFEHFFDGIDTSPVTDALKSVISLGDQGTPSGRALKQGITAGLNEIIKVMGEAITEGEIFFLDLEIGMLKSKPTIAQLRDAIDDVKTALKEVVDVATTAWDILGKIRAVGTAVVDFGSPEQLLAGKGYEKELGHAPAHADGGLVGRPAPGEFFASVEPGELIIPKQYAEVIQRSEPSNDRGPTGSTTTIAELHVHIDAKDGVTDATQLSASGISVALERLQLASGR